MSKEKVQLVKELHRSARKNFPRRRVIIKGYDDLWQADLVDMRAYTHQNKGNQYILVVIGTFSKYAWAEPIKNKTGNIVIKAFGKIIKSRKPKNVQTDDVYSNIKIAAPGKFKVGDFVRLSKYKMLFEKGYTPNWTTEVFKVKVIQKTNPVSYLLQDLSNNDIKRAFYEQELSKVKDKNVYLVEKILRKKGDKVFVKWLGFDKSHNSWIDKDNVL
ncbi:uncharacterized protein [Prorops nasuta]|uniref:uncharacterized protein n=1 Tax=Prorops nasuta TaxID=863751 RepID=UPI0034D0015C